MCGIVGYIGKKNAVSVGLECLKQLEYRGYDSAGAAFFDAKDHITVVKAVGRVRNLEEKLGTAHTAPLAIFHTRWATHGGVTEANAHPHADCTGNVYVAHNGIVENYKELRSALEKSGHKFTSQTDTEVIPHLIEEELKNNRFEDAVRMALVKIRGTYGLVVLYDKEPDMLIAARNFSPLLVGIGTDEYIVASDASAVLKHTKNVIYLDDGEIAVLTPREHRIYDLNRNELAKKSHTIEWSLEQSQKGGYPHFMLKEIFEEPEAIENSLRGRLIPEEGLVKLGGLAEVTEELRHAKRILIAACGTAYLAGRIAEYMLEEYAGIPVEADIASEFRYRKPVFRAGDVFLAISQSGETADNAAAMREAKEKGITTLGLVHVGGSTLARY